mmetsp:Transcript_122375/g.357220  ORF Transcript_122375/g.357220 Transcript_122375/m.357220 type:complete len:356 (+) Transcript_122375:676-1743(+)
MACLKWPTSDLGPPAASFMALASCRSSTLMEASATAAWSCAERRWLATVRAMSQVVSSTPASLAASTASSSSSAPTPLCRASLRARRLAFSSAVCALHAWSTGSALTFPWANLIAMRFADALLIASLATPALRARSMARLSVSGLPPCAASRSSCSLRTRRSSAPLRSRSASLRSRSAAASWLERCSWSLLCSSLWPASTSFKAASAGSRRPAATPAERASSMAPRSDSAFRGLLSRAACSFCWASCSRCTAFTFSRARSPSEMSDGSTSPTPACWASDRAHCNTVGSSRIEPSSVVCSVCRASLRRCSWGRDNGVLEGVRERGVGGASERRLPVDPNAGKPPKSLCGGNRSSML